jgi:excisionase family DNA binding protein
MKLLNVEQAASRLNVSTRTVYRMIAEAQLVGLKVRGSLRVLESSLDDYIKRQIFAYSLEVGVDFVTENDND